MVEKRNVYVGHRYVPKVMGEWDKQETYEGLSIVTYQGASYTSKKRVPVGIDISNEEYWVITGNYNAQIEEYREEVKEIKKLYHQKTKNIKDFGAVGNANFYNKNDKKYYVDENFTTLSKDDTAAFKEAISYAEKEMNGLKIIIPAGNYLVSSTLEINNSNTLFQGDGRLITKIFFNGKNADFFKISKIGYNTFKDITFSANEIDNNSTAFHFDMTLPEDNGKPTYQYYFDNCTFHSFYRVIDITGNELCSEMMFSKVRFHNNFNVFRSKNVQAVNHHFYGCDFENYTLGENSEEYTTNKNLSDTTVFDIVRSGTINVFGGSVMIYGTTVFLNPDGEYIQPHSNGKINFYGVRWEMFDTNDKNVIFRHSGNFILNNYLNINISNSMIYQRTEARGNILGKLLNNMNITFENTNIFESSKIIGYVNASTGASWSKLIVKNTSGLSYEQILDESSSTSYSLSHLVKFENVIKNNGTTKDFEMVPLGHSKKMKRLLGQNKFSQLPSNDETMEIYIPKNVILHRASISRHVETNIDTIYTFTDENEKQIGEITIPAKGGYEEIKLGDILKKEESVIKVSATGATAKIYGFISIDYF